jgi:hypothetical protein
MEKLPEFSTKSASFTGLFLFFGRVCRNFAATTLFESSRVQEFKSLTVLKKV